MNDQRPRTFHCLRYADADRALDFLRALGLTERLVVRDPDDPGVVVHAQLAWRGICGVMLGSERDDALAGVIGRGAVVLVVERDDDVDALLARALDAGATLHQGLTEPPHGGRFAAVLDAEGGYWGFDSYAGE